MTVILLRTLLVWNSAVVSVFGLLMAIFMAHPAGWVWAGVCWSVALAMLAGASALDRRFAQRD
ncbi:MAG TPA: hypothetical protein VHX88_10690 [Solirubrobacteraceae bacterium]|nr:hypothetical protein [Solirubrobacteraceae bacterium]